MKRVLSTCSVGLLSLAAACGSSTSTPADSGVADTGAPADAGGGGGGPDSGVKAPYCDGLGVADSANAVVLLNYYGFSGELKTEGCNTMVGGLADGTHVMNVTGIYDLDTNDNGAGAPQAAVFLTNCSDVGMTGFNPPAPMAWTAPSGSSSVAAAYGSATATDIYGIVTAVYAWAVTDTGPKGGSLYIQDKAPAAGMPPAKSGVQVYFPKGGAASYGNPPSIGNVVHITNVSWMPYKNVAQFSASMTTRVTVIGSAALPPPVSLSASQLGPMTSPSGATYEGMRVSISGGPFTVKGSKASMTCPPGVQYMSGP